MVKKITRWSPDTCDCVLEYEWDTEDELDSREHTFKNSVKECSAHSEVSLEKKYPVVLSENRTKNKILKEVIDSVESLRQEVIEKGESRFELADGVKYKYSFSGTGENRVFDFEFTGKDLKKSEKDIIKGIVDSKHSGKAKLKE